MNLHRLLRERDRPIRVGLIGAGKFGSMYLATARTTPGVEVTAIADLDADRARAVAATFGHAPRLLTDDADDLIAADVDVVADATGSAVAGVRHVLACCAAGRDIVMVNVEADALAGPLLAERARAAGIIYSLAYGDQPALVAELVDWARTAGFEVVCAGKGTKYLPAYHGSTPDTVWEHYGLTADEAAAGGMRAQMFNSFLDGTKSAIEMAAVANATGLEAAPGGLTFPPAGANELATVLRPATDGGALRVRGQVEVVSSLARDGAPVDRDLRFGVFCVIEAPTPYVARCFAEYGLQTDPSGRYAAMYKPYHLIGLELGLSVASVALRREPTGAPDAFRADAVAVAKRDLEVGEVLDGEGGYRVYGALRPAAVSVTDGALPIGLTDGVRVRAPVTAGSVVRYEDVDIDETTVAVRLRRELERQAASSPS